MKKTTLFLAVLIFMSASLIAQKTAPNQKREETDRFLLTRLDMPETRTMRENQMPDIWSITNDRHDNNLKSDVALKLKLDSLVCNQWEVNSGLWSGIYKKEFVYDADGNNTKEIDYDWALSGSRWIPSVRGESAYDVSGNRIQYIGYYWQGTNGKWSPQEKNEYAYSMDNMTHHIIYNWNETYSQWIASCKEEYLYNNNGNMIQYIHYYWLDTAGQWIPGYKSDMDYEANNMLQKTFCYWDETTNQWLNSQKTAFTYNAGNQKLSETDFNWDENNSLWISSSKTDYSYDANGRNTQYIDYVRETNNWIAVLKTDYSYDTYGNKNQSLYSEWDDASGLWIADYKYEYTFDSDSNLIQTSFHFWDKTGNQWCIVKKIDYDYNNSFSFSDLLLPHFCISEPQQVPLHFSHMINSANECIWDRTLWLPLYEYALYYSSQDITSVSEPNTASMKVSPNPVSDYLTVTLDKNYENARFELFDMQGKKVLTENVTNQGKVNVQELNPGIYYYNIIAGQERQSGKLIKN